MVLRERTRGWTTSASTCGFFCLQRRASRAPARDKHQPHQLRLPRESVLGEHVLYVGEDRALLVTRRRGDLRDAHALGHQYRHPAFHPREVEGSLSPRQHALLPPGQEFTMLFLDPPDHPRLRALVKTSLHGAR